MLRPDAYTVRPVGQPETVQRSAATGDLRQEVFQRNLAGLLGQSVQGEILSKLTDGSFLVKVAGTPARMMLPQNAQVGSQVPMTLVGLNPRPTFQVGTGNAPGAGPQFAFTEAAPPLLPGPKGSAARGEPLAYREGGAGMAKLVAANALELETARPDAAAKPAPPSQQAAQQAAARTDAKPPPVVLPTGLATLMGEDEAAPAPDLPDDAPPEDGPDGAANRRMQAGPGLAARADHAAVDRALADKGLAPASRQPGGGTSLESDWIDPAPGDDAIGDHTATRLPGRAADGLALERGPSYRPVDRALAEHGPQPRGADAAPPDGPELTPAERAAVRAALLARAAADMAQPGAASAKSAAHAASLLGKAPIIPAAYLPEIDPKSTPAQISDSARTLTTVLAAAQGLPARTAVLSAAPLASSPEVAPEHIAAALKDAVGKSGLFYESHVRAWAEGRLALPELASEPQMQRPATQLQAHSGQPQPLDTATAQFINLQLTTQEQARVEWQGQVWPGQQMQWDIQRDAPKRGQAGEPDEAATTWRSGVRFSMPHLGDVHAQLMITNGQLHIQVRAGSETTRDQLRQHSRALASALEAAGSPLSSLDIGGTAGDGNE